MLTCDCGACFDVGAARPGAKIKCPECQQPLEVPPRTQVSPRTSAFALASVALALIGAFTVVGTGLAVLLGLVALLHIAISRGRFKGIGLAVFGISAGALLTAVTLLGLSSGKLAALGNRAREANLSTQIDPWATPEDGLAKAPDRSCAVKVPSGDWGLVRAARSDDPAVYGVQKDRALVMLNPHKQAYVDLRIDRSSQASEAPTLGQYFKVVSSEFTGEKVPAFGRNQFMGNQDDDGPSGAVGGSSGLQVVRQTPSLLLPGHGGTLDGLETVFDVRRGGQRWRFIVRVYRKPGVLPDQPRWDNFAVQVGQGGLAKNGVEVAPSPVYVIRAYAPLSRFQENEAELRLALDSFRITAPPTKR